MEDNRLPVEVALNSIKQSVVQYTSALCNEYELPPVMVIQVLQEIVYENRINALNVALNQIRSANTPTEEIDIPASNLVDALSNQEDDDDSIEE